MSRMIPRAFGDLRRDFALVITKVRPDHGGIGIHRYYGSTRSRAVWSYGALDPGPCLSWARRGKG